MKMKNEIQNNISQICRVTNSLKFSRFIIYCQIIQSQLAGKNEIEVIQIDDLDPSSKPGSQGGSRWKGMGMRCLLAKVAL